jgi:hypothetical protein
LFLLNFIFLIFSEEEFTQYYLNERLSFSKHISQSKQTVKNSLQVSPEEFDWRNHSAVTDVKNQVDHRPFVLFQFNIFSFRVNVDLVGHLVSPEILKEFGRPKKEI